MTTEARTMRVAIGFHRSAIEDWDELAAYTVEAERLGVAFAWSAEAWAHDALTPLAYLAGKTERITLGTGIVQVGTRTPALIAMTSMAMASLTRDRFILGLGVSGPQVIEGWHGLPFDRPITRMRETIEIVRAIARGERSHYQGTIYQLPRPGGEGKALRSGARPHQFPIYLATLSPKSLELTGELADGWLGTSFIPEQAEVMFSHIRAGADRAGRSLADLDLQAGGAVEFSDDVDALVEKRRPAVAFQLGAMGSREHNFYNMAFQRAGYTDVGRRVQALWLDGYREDAARAVPAELVLKSSLIGTEAMVRARVQAYRGAGVTTLRVDPGGATLAERLDTLGRIVAIVQSVAAEPAAVR
jgi:F420-dependent oxidoreductase-like protein